MYVHYVIIEKYAVHVLILQKVEGISGQNCGHVLPNNRCKVRLGRAFTREDKGSGRAACCNDNGAEETLFMSASSHSACKNRELAFLASSLASVRDSHFYLCSALPQATAPALGCNEAIHDIK